MGVYVPNFQRTLSVRWLDRQQNEQKLYCGVFFSWMAEADNRNKLLWDWSPLEVFVVLGFWNLETELPEKYYF